MISHDPERVLVACPDSRPPAYQAVVGLARSRRLHSFQTAYYHKRPLPLASLGRRLAPARLAQAKRMLERRHDSAIPAELVCPSWSYDAILQVEARIATRWPQTRFALTKWRAERFDRALARTLDRDRPDAALIFSDIGSDHALPACRRLGTRAILSMVHGDIREEREILEREAESSPEFFRIYLGDGALDHAELNWLHDRRLRDLELADRVLVPSEHIVETLVRHGTPGSKISLIPYAADTQRFRPLCDKRPTDSCTFLFAGGITQRKGIRYLLEAWRRVRRPGWRLQLLGGLPHDPGPLGAYLDDVDHLGRVSHTEMAARMAAADVFVFPSLFEGSAVVTYEALACGLPSIVTPNAGSVVRQGVDGFIVPPCDIESLADRMEQLGSDPELRGEMAVSARSRALEFGWKRYHASLIAAIDETLGDRESASDRGPVAVAALFSNSSGA
jgi:starch synthase